MHRDLKAENVVFSKSSFKDGFDNLELKVIDFGFANIDNKNEMKEYLGTPHYMAPEILLKKPYGAAVDIWALGVLTYLIIDGDFPFNASTKKEMHEAIINGELVFKNEAAWSEVS